MYGGLQLRTLNFAACLMLAGTPQSTVPYICHSHNLLTYVHIMYCKDLSTQ